MAKLNEVLHKELLRRNRQLATEELRRLRRRTAKLTGKEILAALRKHRGLVADSY